MSQFDHIASLHRLREEQLRVLNLLALGATLAEACAALNIDQSTVRGWYLQNADFCEMFDRVGRVRAEAMQLLNSVQRPVELPDTANVSWYRRADYARLRRLFTDGGSLPRTWETWKKRAEKQQRELEKGGWKIRRVFIDPDEFPSWCQRNGLEMDQNARMLHACYRGALEESREAA